MKRVILSIVAFLFMGGGAFAQEDIYYPVEEFDLVIATSGTTTVINQSAGYSGTSWFLIDGSDSPLDTKSLKNPAASYSVQVYRVGLADSNANNVTLSTVNSSGATYTLYYQQGNVNSVNLWIGSGVTKIGDTVALSGSTCETIEFYPEFARFYRIGVLTGMTPFETIRAKLVVQ